MNRPTLCLLLALALPLASSVDVSAQQGVSSAQDAEARTAFEGAVAAFNDGDYESALVFFRRAYDLSGRAELLYNMGQCADRLRRDDEAIEAFEAYLDAAPDAPNAGTVRSRLAHLQAAQRRAPEAVPTPEETAVRSEAEASPPERREEPFQAAAEEDSGLSSGAIWGIALGSVAAVGAAVLIGILAAGGDGEEPDVVLQGLR